MSRLALNSRAQAIKPPSGIEQQEIFYWLKKLSSLTAWRRIFSYYQAWATVAEQSIREADAQGWANTTAAPEAHPK